jgi:hypothetical protein
MYTLAETFYNCTAAHFPFIIVYVGAYGNVCPNNFNSSLEIGSANRIDTAVKKLQPNKHNLKTNMERI